MATVTEISRESSRVAAIFPECILQSYRWNSGALIPDVPGPTGLGRGRSSPL